MLRKIFGPVEDWRSRRVKRKEKMMNWKAIPELKYIKHNQKPKTSVGGDCILEGKTWRH